MNVKDNLTTLPRLGVKQMIGWGANVSTKSVAGLKGCLRFKSNRTVDYAAAVFGKSVRLCYFSLVIWYDAVLVFRQPCRL